MIIFRVFLLIFFGVCVSSLQLASQDFDLDSGKIEDDEVLVNNIINEVIEVENEKQNEFAKVEAVYMNGTHSELSLDNGQKVILESPQVMMTFSQRRPSTNERNVCKPKPKPSLIPGTNLKTRTYYNLRLKRFPEGIITWTAKAKDNYNFLQVDKDPSHQYNYKEGQEWFEDSLWEFIPVLNQGNETGWYGLRNRGRKGAYLTWAPDNWINDHAYHLILDRSYPGIHKKGDFFLKPMKIVVNDREVYYQIRLRNLPNASVTWSETRYGDKGSRYLQADVGTGSHYVKYWKGNEWFDDTLFIFDEVKQAQEVSQGKDEDIGDLERE